MKAPPPVFPNVSNIAIMTATKDFLGNESDTTIGGTLPD